MTVAICLHGSEGLKRGGRWGVSAMAIDELCVGALSSSRSGRGLVWYTGSMMDGCSCKRGLCYSTTVKKIHRGVGSTDREAVKERETTIASGAYDV
jgi:hypothetical protein